MLQTTQSNIVTQIPDKFLSLAVGQGAAFNHVRKEVVPSLMELVD